MKNKVNQISGGFSPPLFTGIESLSASEEIYEFIKQANRRNLWKPELFSGYQGISEIYKKDGQRRLPDKKGVNFENLFVR